MPWDETLHLFHRNDVLHLAPFFTNEWLTGTQMDNREAQNLEIVFRLHPDSYATNRATAEWRSIGTAMVEGSITHVAICFNVTTGGKGHASTFHPNQGNHWVAVIVDVEGKKIQYADPYRGSIATKLEEMIRWWIGQHFEEGCFSVERLECGAQDDTVNKLLGPKYAAAIRRRRAQASMIISHTRDKVVRASFR